MSNIPSLQKLVRQLQKVPYLTSKNLYSVALFLGQDKSGVTMLLLDLIKQAQQSIKACIKCFNLHESDENVCSICLDKKRDQNTICIVESWLDLVAIERAGEYRGLYHVLGGALSPLDGIGPEQLTIKELLVRVNNVVSEIIFATNPTPEGEATAAYIVSQLKVTKTIVVSKFASGVPTGASLAYMDRITISKALLGRRPF